jgi:UDP-N-acetylmuramate dehydrogenase
MEIFENHSLKPFNTFAIDAKAKFFIEIASIKELQELLNEAKFKSIEKLIIGGGSNILLVKDFDGLVIKNSIKGRELLNETDTEYFVKAGAGEDWHDFVMYCVDNNYAGLENLSLIPGCVGAGPMQNIGAYGVELKSCLKEVEAINIKDGTVRVFSNEQCEFGYRESIFKKALKGQYIITSVTYNLNKTPIFQTSYGDIEKELSSIKKEDITIKDVSNAVCKIRNSKIPNPAVIHNAGSFFKNPEIPYQKLIKLKELYPDIVSYKISENMVKLAAGWLIENAGWKGKSIGDAGVHKNQALVLVNHGNANGYELIELSDKIIKDVKSKYNVDLEREVNIV